jgi:kynurenine formamidase
MTRIVDLSHPISAGMYTHPGLPGPAVAPFRTRESYREAAGTDFQVDRIDLVGNTGTYLDSPFHRFADGDDLAAVPLAAVVDLPIHVLRITHRRDVGVEDLTDGLAAVDLTGAAVLLHTGGDRAWGTKAYADDAPFLTGEGAHWLAQRRPALVGIDAVNIDDLEDMTRPAHTVLLGSGVLILEHLTGLSALSQAGGRLHAAPPAWHGVGTWPVRVYALVDDGDENRDAAPAQLRKRAIGDATGTAPGFRSSSSSSKPALG